MAQTWLASNKQGAEALVLMGSTVLRNKRDTKFPFPILTIDGELDGLLHVTRQAEAYYHQVLASLKQHARTTTTSSNSSSIVSASTLSSDQISAALLAGQMQQPVVLLEGLNHWSFASG